MGSTMKRVALFSVLAAVFPALTAPAAEPALAAKGRTAFAPCAACHGTTADAKKLGPTLFRVVGRKAGSLPGFKASPALSGSGKTWTPAELDAFLASPRKAVPGNRMPYAGMANPEQRKAVIAYLATLK